MRLFFLGLIIGSPVSAQINGTLSCPDAGLQTYLLDLIDVLYSNGLTAFEELLVGVAETDSGYALLESLYTAPPLTILPPTDMAFDGLPGGVSSLAAEVQVDLLALHILTGAWGPSSLPSEDGMDAVAATSLSIASYMNDTGSDSPAFQVAALEQGEAGTMVVGMATSNATSWTSPIDLGGTALSNLVILPVDTVIAFPPSLSTALTLGTTTRSAGGLTQLAAALNTSGGAGSLEFLTSGGFTIFAPVDDAWTEEAVSALGGSAATLLGNHYTTNYTLYSPAWTGPGTFPSLAVESGQAVAVAYNSSGSFVSLGTTTARILRSDVALENGVMHIIDTVLMSPSVPSPSATATGSFTIPGGLESTAADAVQTAPGAPPMPSALTSHGGRAGAVPPIPVLCTVLISVAIYFKAM